MSAAPARPQRTTGLRWYERREKDGPWHISACLTHGRQLAALRFVDVGATLPGVETEPIPASACAVCHNPALLGEVERCTCETRPRRCPVHHEHRGGA